MDGFYEWRTIYDSPRPAKSPKEPVYVTRSDGQPLAVAGLWASWRDPAAGEDAPWLHTCCIVTTSANDTMAPIHDRMPVILEPADWSTWLDVTHTDRDELSALMMPAERGVVRVIDVAPIVNSIRNNGPELITPITR
jgi:putative SOS response-associated peptidase YedK